MKRTVTFLIAFFAALSLVSCAGRGGGDGQTSADIPTETVSGSAVSTSVPSTSAPGTTAAPETDPPVTPPVTDEPDDGIDFSDTLFIGDSRTAGLYLYGRIDGAKYFARTSMNVFNCFNDKPSETGTGDAALEEYLKENRFGKIYILLGINEIGYSYDSIIDGYGKLIAKLRLLQPDARIVIQSNMHVTKAKSDANPKTFNNDRINILNERLEQFCEENELFFLDITSAFDDASGNLDTKYTREGIHFNAEGYHVWRDWLKVNGLV